jgi:hypothetical protein
VQKTAEQTQADVLRMSVPAEPDKSIEMLILTLSGETRTAFVDPYDGAVIGTIPEGGVMQIVRKIHSLQYFGSLRRSCGGSSGQKDRLACRRPPRAGMPLSVSLPLWLSPVCFIRWLAFPSSPG